MTSQWADSNVSRCSSHPTHCITRFCGACPYTPLCEVCCSLNNSHHGHETYSIDHFVKHIEQNFLIREKKLCEFLTDRIKHLKQCINENGMSIDETIGEIRERGAELKMNIDAIVDDLTKSCRKARADDEKILGKRENEICLLQSTVEGKVRSIQTLLEGGNYTNVVEFAKTLTRTESPPPLASFSEYLKEEFVLSTYSHDSLIDLFGKFKKKRLAFNESSFEFDEDVVTSMGNYIDQVDETVCQSVPSSAAQDVSSICNVRQTDDKLKDVGAPLKSKSVAYKIGTNLKIDEEISHPSNIPQDETSCLSNKQLDMNFSEAEKMSDSAPEVLSPLKHHPYVISGKATEKSEFVPAKGVRSISVSSNLNMAWISFHGEKKVQLIDEKGNLCKNILSDRTIVDTCLSTLTGNLWAIFSDKSIRELTANSGTWVTLVRTSEYANCLCIGDKDDILVGLQGEIIRYDRNGQMKQKLDNKRPGKKIVSNPDRIDQNRDNGNIAIVDLQDGNKGAIVIIDKYLEPVFTFKGNSDSDKLFVPKDVCFDVGHNLLIADNEGKRVIMLNGSGQYLREIYSSCLQPVAIGTHILNGTFWIGFHDRTIKTISYLD